MGFFKSEFVGSHGVFFPAIKIVMWVMIAVLVLILVIEPRLLTTLLTWAFIFAPIWAPLLLIALFWNNWVKYVRAKYIATVEPVLLEIRIPRDIAKTPRAMEMALTALNLGPGETTFIARWWEGKVRPWWSLELVSIEGKVHFYIWSFKKQRSFVESQIYAQFPDVEIVEVDDYMSGITGKEKGVEFWGMEYIFSKPDAYPIKTYIDFELDQPVKDTESVADPLSSVFEKFSALGPGEIMAIQIVIRKNNGGKYDAFTPWTNAPDWKEEAKAEIENIYAKAKPEVKDLVTGEISEGYPLLKPAEVNVIKALERSIDKSGYDTGIRSIYMAKEGSFTGERIGPNLVHVFQPFKSGYLNSFQPSAFWHVTLDYPWQDIGKRRTKAYSVGVVDAFKRRSFFHPPYRHLVMVMTPEELATLYHFPSRETKAPGLDRIPSTKGEPPANLPT